MSGAVVLLVALASIIPASGISFSAAKLLWLIPLFVGAVFLLNRQYRYYSIAMRIPFSIALADIPQLESQSSLKHGQAETRTKGKP
jgi:cytochrome b subunit of formate dehydrogenase